MILRLALACAPPDDPPLPTDPVAPEPPTLQLTSEVLDVPPGSPQHHATVAIRPDGVAIGAWRGRGRTDALRLADGRGEPLQLATLAPVNHPQVRATDDGYLVVATMDQARGLAGVAVAAGAREVYGAVILEAGLAALLPDLDVRGDQGLLVWGEPDGIHCVAFTGAFEDQRPAACPQADGVVYSVTARLGEGRTAFAWDALRADGFETVVAVDRGDGPVAEVLAAGSTVPGRPGVAVDDASGRHTVVWTASASDDDPVSAWLATYDPDGALQAGPLPLGHAPGAASVTWPTLAGPLDGQLLLAWVEGDALWLQLRDAATGEPVGEPLDAAADFDGAALRPSVDVAQPPDGGLIGIVSWETPIDGAVYDTDRTLHVRTFALLP
ncbi:MAG: hypothetical protein R3F59_16625 [Myxococcota bacterium]